MVLMEKDNSTKYVADVHIEQHLANGYRIVGETVGDKPSVEEVPTTKPKTTKKRKS